MYDYLDKAQGYSKYFVNKSTFCGNIKQKLCIKTRRKNRINEKGRLNKR